MNTHSIKSLVRNDQLRLIDFLNFLHWKRRPFDDALAVYVAGQALAGNDLSGPAWVARFSFILSVLRGAWEYSTLHGIGQAWLRITERLANPPRSVWDDPFEGGTE